MKSSLIAMILSTAVGVLARDSYYCGYTLVNTWEGRVTQSDLARAYCNKWDTCNGKEWNVIYDIVSEPGPGDFWELHSTGVFCTAGCYETSSGPKCH